MGNTILSDLLATMKSTFRINRATVDASGLTASRTITIPDASLTVAGYFSATQRLLGRNSGGAGGAEELTISQGLDWVSTTRGTILYRGASGWAGLAPGASGTLLKSNGSGADPSWAALTRRINIIGWQTVPDTSGDCFPEPYLVKATNDVWKRLVWVFNDTATRIGFFGGFRVPKDYVGTPKIIISWTSTATTNNAVWDFEYRSVTGDNTASLDQTGNQESVTVTDGAPGAAHRKMEASVALTASNLAVDDEVEFGFFRDGADGSDTMAAAAMLFSLEFEYATA